MIEASTTRSPSIPLKRSCGSTTASASAPMRQVPAGWWSVLAWRAGVGEVVLVGLHLRPRQALGQDEGLQRVLPHDLARQLQALDRHLAVIGVGPVVRVDQRRGRRVGAGQPHRAARARAQEGRVQRDARLAAWRRRRPRSPSRGRGGTGCRASGPIGSAYQKPPVSKRVEATGPLRVSRYCRPASADQMRLGVAVIGVRAGAFGDHEEVEVVLQVRADARAGRGRPGCRARAR